MNFVKIFIIVSALILSLNSCEHKTPSHPAVDVTDYVVAPKTIPAVFNFIGFAQSSHPVEIRARVEGYLDKIAYVEGQFVNEGDLLFQLDPKPFQAKVAEAQAEVARQAAQMTNAQLTVDRLTPLYEKKAASKKDLDNATAGLLSTQAALMAAQAQLLLAQINLDYTTIRSPIHGLTEKAKLREGALINPASNSLLTTVSVIDPIWVYFTVSDNDLLRARLQLEQKTITLPSQEDIVLPPENKYIAEAYFSDMTPYANKGKVDYSSPTFDQTTGTMQVRAVFPNPQGEVRPGQFIRIKLYGAFRPDAIVVPQRALMQKKGGMYVYLVDANNTVRAQDVSGGDWYGDYQIITNGLKAGDHVVVDGINKIRPGMEVKVVGPWTPPPESTPPPAPSLGEP